MLAAAAGYRFGDIEVPATIARAIERMGFVTPTEVQARAIPPLRRGEDLIGQAQTGTGKTAAFGIPIVEKIEPATDHVQALILTPTRELCVQVTEEVARIGQFRGVRTVAIYGGSSMDRQIDALKRGAQVVVGTPGRVLDLIRRGELRLDRVHTVILDEADRMLDMGFIDDIRTIISLLPEQRQSLLFSATFPDTIKRLTRTLMRDPATVQVTPRNSATTQVEHVVIRVENDDKRSVLSRLIRDGRVSSALVFVRTKHGADRLSNQLYRDGIRVAAIHGNKAQSQRIAALDDFKAGRVKVLVATEVAARGIDIDALPHVVNFDLPRSAEDYVHRIGRTGRAGAEGIAISLVSEAELPQLREIEQLIGRRIDVEDAGVGTPHRPSSGSAHGRQAPRPQAGRGNRTLDRSRSGSRRSGPNRSGPRSATWVGLPGERQGTS